MLLVSSLTPSGAAWALECAQASEPGAIVIDAHGAVDAARQYDIASVFGVLGAGAVSPDVVAGMATFRSVAALASAIDASTGSNQPTAHYFAGSVASAVSDLQSLVALLDLSGVPSVAGEEIDRLQAAAVATYDGSMELLLVCPAESSAVRAAITEIAVAAASGLRIRGVAVCPMPRKSDGWPKVIRAAARENVENLVQAVYPVPVQAARRGIAPAFEVSGDDVCTTTVAPHGEQEWIWSVSVPGLSSCQVSIGTWSVDSAYPTTHVVLDIDGRIVRRPVDATLRRCVATDAVISGDSVAITFVAHDGQWPNQQDTRAGEHDG